MHRGGAKCASFFREKKDLNFCITDARGILQDGVEYRLQLVRRPRDDTPEYVAGRSVPLQRLSSGAFALRQARDSAGRIASLARGMTGYE